MPVRMTDDPIDPQEQNNDDSGGGGRGRGGGGGFPGGGGGLISLLPLLFSLFRSKGGLLLVAVLVGGYFLLNKSGACNAGVSQLAQLSRGGVLDPKEFQKANIYEGLEDNDTRNPLPESANLQRFAPAVGQQGEQGSCVAWSSAYAARTILESVRTGQPGESLKFSPSFLYNQIGLEGCQGSYIVRAMEFMQQKGAVPYDRFPYTDQDCSRQPPGNLQQEAQQFRMRGSNRLTMGDRTDMIDMRAIKENLAQGAPVVIGMMVGPSFMQSMMGKEVWEPEPGDEMMQGFGGHAMCVVGYDERKYGGSFLIMNSWGPEWGTNGFAWVKYNHFKTFVREAYGLEPMKNANAPYQCEIGLRKVVYDGNKTKVTEEYMALRNTGSNRFQTISPQKKGERFKVEIKNTTECYIYVFGKETDGSSYTLFPYPLKEEPAKTRYSPFCGVTGVRVFPRDKSMILDSSGNKDMIAVVVSKQPLDWYKLNQTITQNPQTDYSQRVNNALGSQLVRNTSFSSSGKGALQFSVNAGDNQVVASIIEIDKN